MHTRRWLIIGFCIILALALSAGLGIWLGRQAGFFATPEPETQATFTEPVPTAPSAPLPTVSSPSPAPSSPTSSPTASQTAQTLPAHFLITGVPFIEQAPHRKWDEIHEETCEEASVLMVAHFLAGDEAVGADQIEAELQAVIAWEQEHLGLYMDTTAAQTATILRAYFGFGDLVRIIHEATLNDLKREIAAGRPVIVPAAGRLLGNPYFKQPGPIYHMVVAIGYTEDEIIVHDPGTRRGANFHYPTDQFWNAIHDFVEKTDEGMATGTKRLIAVDPRP